MRRFVSGLFVLAVMTGLLLTGGCQRDNSLRIVSINRGQPLMSDLVDFGEIKIELGELSEVYQISEIPTDVVDIDLQYVEIGLGLPTWTPYWASIERATISYVNLETGDAYEPVQVSMSASIKADPEGGRIERTRITIAPGQWKERTFQEFLQVRPEDDDYGPVAQVRATVSIDGTDYVSQNRVRAVKDCDIIFGNFYDDPSRLGQ